MSIDARITSVTVIAPSHCDTCQGSGKDPESTWDDCPSCHGATADNPKVRLTLEPRARGGSAGQTELTLLNPPTLDPAWLSRLVGIAIWGDSDSMYVGDRVWANRVGYTTIKLVGHA